MSLNLKIPQDSFLDEMDYTTVDHPDDSDSLVEISSDQNPSSPVTPKSDTIPVDLNFDHQSRSDVSPDHDSDDSSCSELDSEAEAFYSTFNHNLLSSGDMDDHDLAAEKQRSFGLLMKKNAQLEEELRTMSLKLQESEQENEKFKAEAKKRDSAVLLAEKLRSELETARNEIELRDIYLETEKGHVLEVERRVVDLETKLFESSFRSVNLENELKESRESLGVSEAEISKLREMLSDSQESFSAELTKLINDNADLLANKTFSEEWNKVLEDQIKHHDAVKMEMQRKEAETQAEINALMIDLASRNEHVETLNKALDECKHSYDMLMVEKDGVYANLDNLKAEMRSKDIQIEQMEEQINQLNSKQTELVSVDLIEKNKALLEEMESRSKEMQKMQRKEAELQAEINVLWIDLGSRNEHVEALNKALDEYKHSYDMLMVEKDGVYANLDSLKADMRSKDIQIEQMEKQINQLRGKQTELVSESGVNKELVRAEVKELGKQVELQRNVIAEVEEEKREAIRQLCFCLDHYQSGYKQLVQYFIRIKKQQQGNYGRLR